MRTGIDLCGTLMARPHGFSTDAIEWATTAFMPRAQRFPEQEGSMAKNEDFETSTGTGGETHQQVPKKGPHSKKDAHLTTNQGIRVSDNQNSLRAGARSEFWLSETRMP